RSAAAQVPPVHGRGNYTQAAAGGRLRSPDRGWQMTHRARHRPHAAQGVTLLDHHGCNSVCRLPDPEPSIVAPVVHCGCAILGEHRGTGTLQRQVRTGLPLKPVERWTGAEAHALREALRKTVRGYAEYLGVAPRTVAKWEAERAKIVLRIETSQFLIPHLGAHPRNPNYASTRSSPGRKLTGIDNQTCFRSA